jgi:hypothetical protein
VITFKYNIFFEKKQAHEKKNFGVCFAFNFHKTFLATPPKPLAILAPLWYNRVAGKGEQSRINSGFVEPC